MIWTGGLGDVFVVYSWLRPRKDETQLIFSPQGRALTEFLTFMGYKCQLCDLSMTYHSKAAVEAKWGVINQEDASISRVFPMIAGGKLTYKSIFDDEAFQKYEHERLSCPYTILSPASVHYREGRNLSTKEIEWCVNDSPHKVVIIHKGKFSFPHTFKTINMVNKTTIPEAMALIYHASGYYGVDSCWAALACQRPYPCTIKGNGEHYYRWREVYQSGSTGNVKTLVSFEGKQGLVGGRVTGKNTIMRIWRDYESDTTN